MTAPTDPPTQGAPDESRSGPDVSDAIRTAEAGSQVEGVHDRGQAATTGEAPVEQVRDEPEMTEGQVVYGSEGGGDPAAPGTAQPSSGAAQSVRGARPIDEAGER